jgi:hypothetical protein
MAMDAATLASSMKSKMDAVAASYKNGEKDNFDALETLAEAIIEHIQTNAQVIIAGGSSSGTYPVV